MDLEQQISEEEETEELQAEESIEDLVSRLADEGVEPEFEDPTPPTIEPVEAPEAEPEDGRARDERGRFAKKVSEPQGSTKAQEPTDRETEVQQASTPADPIPVPVSWAAEAREAFTRLPRELQEVVAARESQRESLLHDTRRKWAAVEELVAPYEEHWARQGVSLPQVLRQQFAYADGLARDPINTGLQLLGSYGVTAQMLFQALTQGQVQHGGQPQPQQEFRDSRFDAFLEQQQLAEQQRQEAYARSVLDSFSNQRDEGGNLKHPYWLELYPDMQALAAGMRSRYPQADGHEILERTYKAALASNPDISAKVEQQREQARKAEEAKRVQNARRMGSSLTGAPGGKMVKQIPNDDVEALVRALANGEIE